MEPFFVRDQHLEAFAPFSVRLAAALSECGCPTGNELLESLVGECVQCGMQVNGREILQLADAVEKVEDTTKLGRLRFAYCARKGCKSYFYKIKFFAHPQFDWGRILAQIDKVPDEETSEQIANRELIVAARKAMRRQFVSRVCAGAALIVLLLAMFQWYNGGTIPFLREPEKFAVDPIRNLTHLETEE